LIGCALNGGRDRVIAGGAGAKSGERTVLIDT